MAQGYISLESLASLRLVDYLVVSVGWFGGTAMHTPNVFGLDCVQYESKANRTLIHLHSLLWELEIYAVQFTVTQGKLKPYSPAYVGSVSELVVLGN